MKIPAEFCFHAVLKKDCKLEDNKKTFLPDKMEVISFDIFLLVLYILI